MELLCFLLACVAVWVVASLGLGAQTKIKRLEVRAAELGSDGRRHAAAGTVLYDRIEALRVRLEAVEAELKTLKERPPAPALASKPPEPATEAATEPEARPVAAREAAPEAIEATAPPADLSVLPVPLPESMPVADAPPAGATPPAEGSAPVLPVAAPSPEEPTLQGPALAETRVDADRTERPGAAPGARANTTPEVAIPPVAAAVPARPFDWESLVGVRLFSWIAGIAFVLAAVFFLRYSIDAGLLSPPIRLAIGIVGGVALLVVSETRGRHTWNVTANALGAAGIAILFASFFAANALWHLIPALATFALMVLVTAIAVLLAVRHDSVFIALLGLVGGFATPILLSTGEDRPIGLFGYLLVLNVGLAWVGRRRGWTVLIALSVGFTAVYQWGWVVRFLLGRPDELPIAVAVFLVFPVLVAISRLVPVKDEASPRAAFEATATVSALLPLLFALCFAWVPALGAHYQLLFAYLFLLVTALAVIGTLTRAVLLVGASGLATLLVFAGWLPSAHFENALPWPQVLGIVSLFVLFYLLVPYGSAWLARRVPRGEAPFDAGAPASSFAPVRVVAPLLLFAFPLLAYLEPRAKDPLALFGVMFALLAAIAVVALVESAGALYFLAAFFAVVAEAAWSAAWLAPESLHAAPLLYGAFGLFHLGVPLVARRYGKTLDPTWSAPALLIASLALLLFLAAGPVAHLALWGMAILLAILNLGLFFDVRPGKVSWLAGLGMLFSWLVIAVWWATAMTAVLLLPALAIVGSFAVLLVGGNLWAERQSGAAGESRKAVYLGLVGHLFLLFVASQDGLAVPPWPLLGVLFVLDLGILIAALFARRGELHLSAVAASQIVWAVWVLTAFNHPNRAALPWTEIGVLAGLGIASMGLVALPMADRRGADRKLFVVAAVVGLLGSHVVTMVAASCPSSPPDAWIVVPEAAVMLALAFLARKTGWLWLMLLPLLVYMPGTAGVIAERERHAGTTWQELMVIAGVPYAIWLAYPVWLGQRAARARSPFIGAIVASALFFLFGFHAMKEGHLDAVIGILPVAEAALLVGLVARILRIEPEAKRDTGRLALVAGVALAFVTAAIPIQLDKQWITIGWALEAAALAWLYLRIAHKGLLATSGGLVVAVVLRLSLNPAVLAYHPRGAMPVWNWYLYAYLVSAVSLLVVGSILAGEDESFAGFPALPRVSTVARAGATLLLFLLLNIEIADYYSSGASITFNFSSGIAQDLTYTLGWAIFAIALLTVGIVKRSKAARLTALFLLVATIAKAFLHDLWRLGGLYRVGSFVGLAVSLALVAVVLQRFVLVPDGEKKAPDA